MICSKERTLWKNHLIKCFIQLFSAIVLQDYSLKNRFIWTTSPPCYLIFIMCFYLGAEGHIGCLKTLLKDMLVVWRCWKYWASALQRYLSPGGESPAWREKKKIEKMSPTKMRKKGYLAQKCKEMRAKNLAVKWEKENSYHIEEERFIKKEKKEIWQQNKKRRVTKVSNASNISTIETERHIVCQFYILFLQLHVL